jgi:hypothetical protein
LENIFLSGAQSVKNMGKIINSDIQSCTVMSQICDPIIHLESVRASEEEPPPPKKKR